jgi:hypothetical protein
LPGDDFPLLAGDHLLLASSHDTRRNLEYTLQNPNELDYVLDGENHASSWLWRKIFRS